MGRRGVSEEPGIKVEGGHEACRMNGEVVPRGRDWVALPARGREYCDVGNGHVGETLEGEAPAKEGEGQGNREEPR